MNLPFDLTAVYAVDLTAVYAVDLTAAFAVDLTAAFAVDLTAAFAVDLTAIFSVILLALAFRFLEASLLALVCFSYESSCTSTLAAGGPWAWLFIVLVLAKAMVFAIIDWANDAFGFYVTADVWFYATTCWPVGHMRASPLVQPNPRTQSGVVELVPAKVLPEVWLTFGSAASDVWLSALVSC